MSAGGWALASIYLWLIAFPAYLFNRGKLIAKAKEKPVEPSKRTLKLAVLVILCILATAKNYQRQVKISKLKAAAQKLQSISK